MLRSSQSVHVLIFVGLACEVAIYEMALESPEDASSQRLVHAGWPGQTRLLIGAGHCVWLEDL